MIESKLIRGLTFTWTAPAPVGAARPDGSIVNQAPKTTVLTYNTLSGAIYDLGAPNVRTLGLSPGTTMTVNWLDYQPGFTTKVSLTGDTFTGFMSGCWITTFLENGVRKVCHLGTDIDGTVNTKIKEKFGAVMGTNAHGFHPFNAWDMAGEVGPMQRSLIDYSNKSGVREQWLPRIVALVTQGGDFYSIVLFQKDQGTTFVVGGIKRVMPTSGPALRTALGLPNWVRAMPQGR